MPNQLSNVFYLLEKVKYIFLYINIYYFKMNVFFKKKELSYTIIELLQMDW